MVMLSVNFPKTNYHVVFLVHPAQTPLVSYFSTFIKIHEWILNTSMNQSSFIAKRPTYSTEHGEEDCSTGLQ